eukprot:206236-Pelagomonas_calceolata.AAC.4
MEVRAALSPLCKRPLSCKASMQAQVTNLGALTTTSFILSGCKGVKQRTADDEKNDCRTCIITQNRCSRGLQGFQRCQSGDRGQVFRVLRFQSGIKTSDTAGSLVGLCKGNGVTSISNRRDDVSKGILPLCFCSINGAVAGAAVSKSARCMLSSPGGPGASLTVCGMQN